MIVHELAPPPGTSEEDIATLSAGCASENGSRERVRDLLARDPSWVERIGTLAAHAEQAILSMAQGQVLVEEAWRAELNDLRVSIQQPGDGALERLLVERVALSWLALMIAELRRAAAHSQGQGATEAGEFWDRHVSRLNRDFLQAGKALATVRRLRPPQIRVSLRAANRMMETIA